MVVAAHAALRTFGSRLYNALGVEPDRVLLDLEQTDLVEALGKRSEPVRR